MYYLVPPKRWLTYSQLNYLCYFYYQIDWLFSINFLSLLSEKIRIWIYDMLQGRGWKNVLLSLYMIPVKQFPEASVNVSEMQEYLTSCITVWKGGSLVFLSFLKQLHVSSCVLQNIVKMQSFGFFQINNLSYVSWCKLGCTGQFLGPDLVPLKRYFRVNRGVFSWHISTFQF